MRGPFLEEARALTPPSRAAWEAYDSVRASLVDRVDQAMEDATDRAALVGSAPATLLHDNHVNHARFMSSVFAVGSFELLAHTLPWVYRTYHSRGLSLDYFPWAMAAWKRAIGELLPGSLAEPIVAVYDWIVRHHQTIQALADEWGRFEASAPPELEDIKNRFVAKLLEGAHADCLALATDLVVGPADLETLYLGVIQPAMYEVGRRWETGSITVAHEHLATAIVGRIMASLYSRIFTATYTRGRAVVTASTNEFHELGARMVADLLETDGWDVLYLGANLPGKDATDLVGSHQPHLLLVSVTMAFNISGARDLVQAIKDTTKGEAPKIMVGGIVFNQSPGLVDYLGADYWAPDARQGVLTARTVWEELQRR